MLLCFWWVSPRVDPARLGNRGLLGGGRFGLLDAVTRSHRRRRATVRGFRQCRSTPRTFAEGMDALCQRARRSGGKGTGRGLSLADLWARRRPCKGLGAWTNSGVSIASRNIPAVGAIPRSAAVALGGERDASANTLHHRPVQLRQGAGFGEFDQAGLRQAIERCSLMAPRAAAARQDRTANGLPGRGRVPCPILHRRCLTWPSSLS